MLDRAEIEKGVIATVGDITGVADVKLTHNLVTDLAADSLDSVEIMIGIEEKFGICLAENECDKVKTVQDLVDLVCKKLQIA